MNHPELQSVVQQYAALEEARAHNEALADNPVVQRMLEEASHELEVSVEALPESIGETIYGLVSAHQERLSSLELTAQTLRELDQEVPEVVSDQLKQERARRETDPELRFSLFYIERTGAVFETHSDVEITPVGVEPQPTPIEELEPASGTSKEDVARPTVHFGLEQTEDDGAFLTIRGARTTNRVRLSEKFSSKTYADLSAEKLAALHVMLEAGGEYVQISELWKEMYGILQSDENVPDFNRGVSQSIRVFIEDLRFGQQRVFEHNRKRGPSSAYRANPSLRSLPVSDITPEQIRSLKEVVETRRLVAATESLDLPEGVPTIDELFRLVGYIDVRGDVMDAYANRLEAKGETNGKLTAFLRLREELLPDINEMFAGHPLPEADQELTDERIATYNQLIELIDDEDLLLETLVALEDSTEPQHIVAFTVIDALIDLDDDEREALKNLIQMHVIEDRTEFAGSYHKGQYVEDIRHIFEINGRMYVLTDAGKLERVTQGQYRVEDFEEQTSETGIPQVEEALQADGQATLAPAHPIPQAVEAPSKVEKPRKKNTRGVKARRQKNKAAIEQARKKVDQTLEAALSAGLADGAKPGQVRGFLGIRSISGDQMEKILGKKNISADTVLSLADILTVAAYLDLKGTSVWTVPAQRQNVASYVKKAIDKTKEV